LQHANVFIPVFQAIEGVTPVSEGAHDSKVHRLANCRAATTKDYVIRGWERNVRVAVAQDDSYRARLIGRGGYERVGVLGR
jgi:hypothetical protein